MSIQTRDPVVIRSDSSGYVSPAIGRARELGWCPDCVAISQYVLLAPGLDACLYHATRAPQSVPDASGVLAPARVPVEPSTATLDPETGPSGIPAPRRRQVQRAPRANGRYAAPRMLAIAAAIPADTRRARDQVDALAAWEDCPYRLELRADRDRRMSDIWRALVCAADWRTMTYTGTWDALADRAGVSRSTIARALRWFADAGLLATVHTGASARYAGGDTNRAPSYVITVPHVSAAQTPVDELDTPTVGESSRGNHDARESVDGSSALRLESESSQKPTRAVRPSWSLSMAPTTRAARLAAAEALIWHAPTIRRVSARLVRHVLGAFFRAGWSPNDVLYALDHTPAGVASRITGPVNTPAAWMRYRLAAWLAGGQPLPSRSQRARAAHASLLAGRAAGRG